MWRVEEDSGEINNSSNLQKSHISGPEEGNKTITATSSSARLPLWWHFPSAIQMFSMPLYKSMHKTKNKKQKKTLLYRDNSMMEKLCIFRFYLCKCDIILRLNYIGNYISPSWDRNVSQSNYFWIIKLNDLVHETFASLMGLFKGSGY